MGEISAVQQRLQATQTFRDGEWWIVPLHSTVDPEIQRSAFLVPSDGVRKIVLATNIAETSLTIPDVVFVVDSGKLKVITSASTPGHLYKLQPHIVAPGTS